mgnify:CR=1 FL=1
MQPRRMFLILITGGVIAATLAAPAVMASASTIYRLAPSESAVTARVAFFGLASKTARFPGVSGSAAIAGRDPATLALDVEIDARRLEAPDTLTLKRLRGEKFFWVDRYPSVRFTGRGVRMDTSTSGRIGGELTARGVTRPVTLEVRFARDPRSLAPGQALAIAGETVIDRRDFGMTAYPLVVGRKVTIRINARMEAD